MRNDRRIPAFAGFFSVLMLAGVVSAAETRLGPQGAEEGASRRQVWVIPAPIRGLAMQVVVHRPPGAGPFPLAIINHDSTQNAELRAKFPPPDYAAASLWFLQRGYAVVLPQRPGHGATGGPYIEDQGGCEDANYRRAGLAAAESIFAAIDYFGKQSFIRRNQIIVVGQSSGGWGALALASRNPPGVKAVINFAGGRGGRIDNRPNSVCAPTKLVDAAHGFGERARIPTLSIYTENDSYFSPALSKRITDAYRLAGGRGEYRLLPPFGQDGHRLFESPESVTLWGPMVEEFLARIL
jgi:dienelactone hydrolase